MAERDIPTVSDKIRAIGANGTPNRQHATAIAARSGQAEPDKGLKKAVKLFLADDVDDVGEYLVKDLIIPGIKDVFFNFLWALFWGDRRAGGSVIGGNNRTNYSKASQVSRIRTIGQTKKDQQEDEDNAIIRKFDLSNIQFASQAEAKEVLTAMKMYLDEYPTCPVGYLQELIGESGDFTSEYYGWTTLGDARIRPTSRGGWLLVLPKPERL